MLRFGLDGEMMRMKSCNQQEHQASRLESKTGFIVLVIHPHHSNCAVISRHVSDDDLYSLKRSALRFTCAY